MPYLKSIETPVLLTILRAQLDFYGKILTLGQASDCRTTIKKLQSEITSRGEAISVNDRPLFESPASMHFSNHGKTG